MSGFNHDIMVLLFLIQLANLLKNTWMEWLVIAPHRTVL